MNKIKWTSFDQAVGHDAYGELPPLWRGVIDDLAHQHADPNIVYDRYIMRHPTREATGKIIKQALIWRLNGGEVDEAA